MAFKTMLQNFYPVIGYSYCFLFSPSSLPRPFNAKASHTQSFSPTSKYLHCIGDVTLIHGFQYHLVMENT